MVEKQVGKLLGGYEVTIYPTAFGEFSRTETVHGTRIRLLGQQVCTHYATAQEARDAAAALLEIADEIEGRTPAG